MNSDLTDSSINFTPLEKKKDNSTFLNIIIILAILFVIWFFINKNNKDPFDDVMEQEMKYKNFVSNNGMMGPAASSNLMAELSNSKQFTDSYESVLTPRQEIADSTNTSLMTPDERSLAAMNKISQEDSKGTSCNLLGINPSKLSNYKKKFYSMYKHQIECPKNCDLSTYGDQDCYMNKLGMKKCGMTKDDSACGDIFTYDYNNPDVFALGYLAVDNNNAKPCVTCTFDKSGNLLNRSSIAEDVTVFNNSPLPPYNPLASETKSEMIEGFSNKKEGFRMLEQNYDDLPASTQEADAKRLFQQNVSNANVSNYVDFENNVMLNSTGGETQVDKLAEIRTCVSGTCGLSSYGKSIANVYDKLLDTPAYTNRASCDPNAITGVLEDASMSSGYANI